MSNPPQHPGAVSPQWQPPSRYQYQPGPPAVAVAPNGQPLASFADRFLAALIDWAIYFVFSLLWTIPLMIWWFSVSLDFVGSLPPPGVPAEEVPPPDPGDFLAFLVPMLVFVVGSMVFTVLGTYLYWVELQKRWGGQTIGKRVIKTRVIPVNPAQSEVTRGGYALRWAVEWMLGAIVPLFQLIDSLWLLWDKPLQQCLHDKAAQTVVVKVG